MITKFDHQVGIDGFLVKVKFAEYRALLHMHFHCDSVGILRTAPAHLYREGYLIADLHSRAEIILMDDLTVSIQDRLLNADIGVVWILDLQSQASAVSHLIQCESGQPLLRICLEFIAEVAKHLCLVIGSGDISVCIELGQYHRLFHAIVDECISLIALLGERVDLVYGVSREGLPLQLRLCHIIRPAPVKCHIAVYRYNIGCAGCLCEDILHLHLLILKLFAAIQADDHLDIWCLAVNDLTAVCEECSHLRIIGTLVKGEPVSCRLMIDTKLHTSECGKILCDRHNVIVGQLWIDRQRQQDILSMTTHIAHAGKWLIVQCAADATLVCEIIIIWEIPCKLHGRICVNHACTSRPSLIVWIITIHQIDRTMRASQLLQDIILVYIFSTFTSISEINCTSGRSHVK